MKLRFENNNICFRITKDELMELLKNNILTSETMTIKYNIILANDIDDISLKYKNNNFIFTLPYKIVAEHKIPSKKGIVKKIIYKNKTISASLEIDVRNIRK